MRSVSWSIIAQLILYSAHILTASVLLVIDPRDLQYIEDWFDGKKAKRMYKYTEEDRDPGLFAGDVVRVPMDLVSDGVTLANYAESSVTPLLGKTLSLSPSMRNGVEGLVLFGICPIIRNKTAGYKPGGPIGSCVKSIVSREDKLNSSILVMKRVYSLYIDVISEIIKRIRCVYETCT